MSYAVVRQEGFQLPSPPQTTPSTSPSDTAPTSPPPPENSCSLFMPHNVSFLPDSFRKFPSAAQTHAAASTTTDTCPVDFSDELASLIDGHHHPHSSPHERSPYRHNIFDISAPPPSADIYHAQSDLPIHTAAFASPLHPHVHADPSFTFRHTPSPSHRSRSRSRAPSIGPTRTARRDRRANSISSHVSSTSPPPRPHPHAIVIPGRSPAMGGFFVPPGQPTSCPPPEYSLPTPDSISHSFAFGSAHSQHGHHGHGHGHSHSQSQFPYATPSSPYYSYTNNATARTSTPSMGISPSDVESTFNGLGVGIGVPAVHIGGTPTSSSLPATSTVLSSSHHHHMPCSLGGASSAVKSGNGTASAATGSKTAAAASTASSTNDPSLDSHLSEKRRRRRESHNAVERRRRDNINERIGELAGLIPGVLFECDAPLVLPNFASPTSAASSMMDPALALALGGGSAAGAEDLFAMGLFGDSAMHVLSDTMDGLPDLPEETSERTDRGATLKRDMCDDGDVPSNSNTTPATPNTNTSTTTANANANGDPQPQTIKANKGMILRKSVEYIRYLQQLVSVQASRGRELEERVGLLEREVEGLRRGAGSGSGLVSPALTAPTVPLTRKEWSELESMPEDMEVEEDDADLFSDDPRPGRVRLREGSRSRRDDDHEDGKDDRGEGEGESERRGRARQRVRFRTGMSVRAGMKEEQVADGGGGGNGMDVGV
ncbi:hypothetical protein F5I97DRAFT_1832453 [Phlebopus sp. FC_14]|nr:hypothetical protein F5I97DRAFT_1832453 [Phlebopus sp. FC_14]